MDVVSTFLRAFDPTEDDGERTPVLKLCASIVSFKLARMVRCKVIALEEHVVRSVGTTRPGLLNYQYCLLASARDIKC